MLKYIFSAPSRGLWKNLSIRLQEEGIATPVLWIGHRKNDEFARQTFPSCNVVNFNEVNKGIFSLQDCAPETTSKSSEILRETWFPAFKDQAIRMLDRNDYFGAFRSVDRDAVFYKLVFQIHSLLEKEKPDLFIMSESPHFAATLITYRICEYLGIPVISYVSNLTFPALFLKGGIEKPPIALPLSINQDDFKKASREEVDKMIANFRDDTESPRQVGYMVRQYRIERRRRISRPIKVIRNILRGLFSPILPSSMQTRSHYAFHGFSAFSNHAGPASEVLRYITEILAQRALIRAYAERSIAEDNFPTRYVFFPLHYEPERTSNPDGGAWNNQYHAIARLRQLLPDDVAIVVKEHPSQLGSVLQGFRGRSRFFYDAISAITGISFAQIDIPSWKIQKKALFTCTLTGTAALEAAIMGKPTLLMGHPWFRGCPGITLVEDSTSMDEILTNTANIEDIRSYLYRLINEFAVFGVIGPSSEKHFSKWFADSSSKEKEVAGVTEATILAIQTFVKSKHV